MSGQRQSPSPSLDTGGLRNYRPVQRRKRSSPKSLVLQSDPCISNGNPQPFSELGGVKGMSSPFPSPLSIDDPGKKIGTSFPELLDRRGGKFHRIGKKVVENLLQFPLLSSDPFGIPSISICSRIPRFIDFFFNHGEAVLQKSRKEHLPYLQLEASLASPCKIQNVIDQREQMLAALEHVLECTPFGSHSALRVVHRPATRKIR